MSATVANRPAPAVAKLTVQRGNIEDILGEPSLLSVEQGARGEAPEGSWRQMYAFGIMSAAQTLAKGCTLQDLRDWLARFRDTAGAFYREREQRKVST
jgi:hypothetical protein